MKPQYFTKLFFYIICAVIPLALWAGYRGEQLLFEGSFLTLTTLGKAAGIVGICFFAGNLLLSGRYHFMDKIFGGLDQVYLFHRKTGITVFIILSLHVLFTSLAPATISYQAFSRIFFDFDNLALNFGRIGYVGLLSLVVITLYYSGKMKYERLKALHQFMGVFFFAGGVHAFFIPSDISENLYLRYYILGFVAVATASYLWRTVFRKFLLHRRKFIVSQVNKLSENVTEVILDPKNNKAVNFFPGQFIFVKFRQSGFPYEDHPFSLTASTEEGRMRISAKFLGDFTTQLPNLKPGALAEVQGPYGGFSFLRSFHKEQIWIAGGIGITPFISMARTLRDKMLTDYKITLIYSVQSNADLVYKEELEQIAKTNPNFRFIPWVTAEQGYLNASEIQKLTPIENKEVFICGPKPMIGAIKKQLKSSGVNRSNIHFELFKLL